MLGPFTLNADLGVAHAYHDNVFATRNNTEQDWVSVISPGVELVSEGAQHQLRFYGNGDLGRYHRFASEDYRDWRLGAEGRHAYSDTGSLFAGASLAREHEARSSPDTVLGAEPTRYQRTGGFVGINQPLGRFTMRLGTTLDRFDFEDVPAFGGGMIDNDDRNRTMTTAGGRLGYRITDHLEPFVQGAWDRRDYQREVDNAGFRRDSEGYNAAVGLRYQPSSRLDGEVLAGWMEQDYDDPHLPAIRTHDFGARLAWRASGRTVLQATLDRVISETTTPGASGYLRTGLATSVEHLIRPEVSLRAHAGYSDLDYRGIERNEDLLSTGMGLRYYPFEHYYIGLDYSYLQRNSSQAVYDFDSHQMALELGVQSTPAFDPGHLPYAPRDENLADGFYVGLQGGLAEVGTALVGERSHGTGGSLLADFRNDGASFGLFGGYGLDLDAWHLALELETDRDGAGWNHARSEGGREFSASKREDIGASLRAGRMLAHGHEVYGRFGLVRGRFATHYAEAESVEERSDWLNGMRFGGGVEVPLRPHLGLRLDVTYTDYEDQQIAGRRSEDNFTYQESLVRLGLAYRMEDRTERWRERAPASFEGFYLGARAGYGSLLTEVAGARQEPTVLEAEFGAGGVLGGIFAGYGKTFGKVYLGAEVDAVHSDMTWRHEREPTGRTYAVDRKGSYGGSLRAGYVIPSSALLYVSAGPTWTDFETGYERGRQALTQSDAERAWRFGAGVEVPLNESLYLRMELSQSRYDSYHVDYGTGEDRFEIRENLFGVGISYRF